MPETDIIWEDVYKNSVFSTLKTFFLCVLLLLVSVVLITPIVLINMSSEFISSMSLDVKWLGLDKTTSTTYLTTAVTMFMNVILIPFFIDIMVMIEDHETKSNRQIAILNRNFFFMMLNALLLPLTGLTTIKAFI